MRDGKKHILDYTSCSLKKEFELYYEKGQYHSSALLRHVYTTGSLNDLHACKEFTDNQNLATAILRDFVYTPPKVTRVLEEGGTIKFTLELEDGLEIESVIIPMHAHTTLCVSCQVGCSRGCSFCRTAHMGLRRNLHIREIIAQYMCARFIFKKDVQNIVFMGMGEPMDNLDVVLSSIDILTDYRAAGLLPRRISISTSGQCAGLDRFYTKLNENPEKKYNQVTLAVSLHSTNDVVRSSLMPINKQWPLSKLRSMLLKLPHANTKDKLYFEYMIIPGINDSAEDALSLYTFLTDFTAKVNVIAFQSPSNCDLLSATQDDVERFWKYLRTLGVRCYTRHGKGNSIRASCGQLATE